MSVLSSMMLVSKNVDIFIHTVIISICLILITNSTCCVFGIIFSSTPCCEVHSHWVNSFYSHKHWRKSTGDVISYKNYKSQMLKKLSFTYIALLSDFLLLSKISQILPQENRIQHNYFPVINFCLWHISCYKCKIF